VTGTVTAPARRQLAMLREAIQIIKLMWSEDEATFEGEHYSVSGAHCDPKPLQTPSPPILIGGGGEQITLRIVARYADRSNFGGSPEQFAAKCEILKGNCKDVGRDYDEIRKTVQIETVAVAATEEEAQRPFRRARRERSGRSTPPSVRMLPVRWCTPWKDSTGACPPVARMGLPSRAVRRWSSYAARAASPGSSHSTLWTGKEPRIC